MLISANSSLQSVATACTRKFAADRTAPQKLGLVRAHCMHIGSPGVSYYKKRLGAPERIRCACHAPPPPFFTLHAQDLVEFCHALQTGAILPK